MSDPVPPPSPRPTPDGSPGADGPPEHASTRGWGGPEPEASPLEEDSAASPAPPDADDAWPAEPAPDAGAGEAWPDGPAPVAVDPTTEVDGGARPDATEGYAWASDETTGDDDWPAEPPRAGPRAEPDWRPFEDERQLLPSGLERVGRVETVRLAGTSAPPVPARLDTGAARSRMHAAILGTTEGDVRLQLQGQAVTLPRAERPASEGVWVRLRVVLGAADLPISVRVSDPTDGEPLVLGCDVLTGRFVVDPGAVGLAATR